VLLSAALRSDEWTAPPRKSLGTTRQKVRAVVVGNELQKIGGKNMKSEKNALTTETSLG
jgi:hypothetical protein